MLFDAKSLLARERLDRIIKLKKEGRVMSGGLAATPKKDNLSSRLDSSIGAGNTLVTEIAKTTNAIREALIGVPPPAIAKDKEVAERTCPLPGFLGHMIDRSEDSNRTLNYALDELRIVLGEIS
jgi:hypothetical protein